MIISKLNLFRQLLDVAENCGIVEDATMDFLGYGPRITCRDGDEVITIEVNIRKEDKSDAEEVE